MDEALGVSGIGGVQNHLPMRQDLRGSTVVDHGGRHQAEPGMMMLVVVPSEKRLAEASRVLDGAEAVGKARAIFQVPRRWCLSWVRAL